MARTKEEKKIAEEVRKAKEAEAEMILHRTHAENAAEKLRESTLTILFLDTIITSQLVLQFQLLGFRLLLTL